ncbi:hypothetical protein LCGC14_2055010 [marine sediment metagenome]|uniref:Uncharacterized protein n=1 Tax=marine sediment metagenome TaxID=412755 RepID=A0A0F9H1C8_9ZZZZ
MPRKNVAIDVFKSINMHNGDPNVCWEWTGKVNKKDGRPYITINGKRRPSYVIALELFTGELARGRMGLHSCDTEDCCNPHHLSWGTHQDNMDDMVERERHGLPKTVVRAIRKLRIEGRTQQHIAELYGVSRETISAIDTGRIGK